MEQMKPYLMVSFAIQLERWEMIDDREGRQYGIVRHFCPI